MYSPVVIIVKHQCIRIAQRVVSNLVAAIAFLTDTPTEMFWLMGRRKVS